jgi:hypothetical protein
MTVFGHGRHMHMKQARRGLGTRKGVADMKLLRLIVSGILAWGCLVVLPGCQVAPLYKVESYEQVKEDLADLDGVAFPDISKYEESGMLTFIVDQYQKDRSIKAGYGVYTKSDVLDSSGIDSTLSGLGIYVCSLKYWGDELNPPPTLVPNNTYRSIPVQITYGLPTAIDGGEVAENEPLQGRDGGIGYEFDLDGFRYAVGGTVIFLDDELVTPLVQERLAEGKTEILVIVDSILDQKGIPR